MSNRQLKVSCRVSPFLVFITDHILLSLDPFGMALDREVDRALISLMSCLVVSTMHISDTEEEIGVGVDAKKGNECWATQAHHLQKDG